MMMKKLFAALLSCCMILGMLFSPFSVHAAYGQNGDNPIADDAAYSRVTEKILSYAAAHEMQLEQSDLTFAYRLFDMAQVETGGMTASGEYVTFLRASDAYAVIGYFSCSDGEAQDCTYTALHSQLYLDAVYNERIYRLYSAKDCLIEGKQYDLVMSLEGTLYDLRDDTVISDRRPVYLDIQPILTGDVNLDGTICAADAVLLHQAVSGTVELSETQRKKADCNGDGAIDASDALLLMRFLIQDITKLPA